MKINVSDILGFYDIDRDKNFKRNLEIYKMRQAGHTYKVIGKEFGLRDAANVSSICARFDRALYLRKAREEGWDKEYHIVIWDKNCDDWAGIDSTMDREKALEIAAQKSLKTDVMIEVFDVFLDEFNNIIPLCDQPCDIGEIQPIARYLAIRGKIEPVETPEDIND